MAVFGDGAFMGVIKVKWGHKCGPDSIGLVSLSEEDEGLLAVSTRTRVLTEESCGGA